MTFYRNLISGLFFKFLQEKIGGEERAAADRWVVRGGRVLLGSQKRVAILIMNLRLLVHLH